MISKIFLLILGSALLISSSRAGAESEQSSDPGSSFAAFKPATPIPEIMNIQPGETIPPEVFKKYPPKEIALSVVYKKYVEDEKHDSEKTKNPAYDYFQDSEIQLSFSDEIIESVAKNGFFNTHQINALRHTDFSESTSKARARAEDAFVGYHLETSSSPTISASLRPKSAYLSLRAGKAEDNPLNKAGPGDNDLAIGGYGNVFAVFKDDVKNRTTFTMGDSLLSFPGKTAVRTLWFKSAQPLQMTPGGGPYVEAQVWGPLTVEDVDHFIVNCNEKVSATGTPGIIPSASLAKLEKLRVPIFDCLRDKVGDRLIRIRKGKQIYPMAGDQHLPAASESASEATELEGEKAVVGAQ